MAQKSSAWWNFWRIVNCLFTVATVVGIPCTLFILGWVKGGKQTWDLLKFPMLVFASGIVAVLSRVCFIYNRDKEEYRDFLAEIKFVSVNAHTAWSLGGAVACALVGIYLIFPSGGALYERYAGALSIYIAVVGVTLAIHAFYRNTAPITDVNHLLEMLINDLKSCSPSSTLWFVYPAMNIGYYRYHCMGEVDDDHISNKFKEALKVCAGRLKKKAQVITYPQNLYEATYAAYDKMVSGTEDQGRIKECAANADDYVFDFVDRGKRGHFFEFKPDEFPPQVVVIGAITYIIVSYGLPYFQNGAFVIPEHKATEKGKTPAVLYVFRREDAALSTMISNHLNHLVDGRAATTPTNRNDNNGAAAQFASPSSASTAAPSN